MPRYFQYAALNAARDGFASVNGLEPVRIDACFTLCLRDRFFAGGRSLPPGYIIAETARERKKTRARRKERPRRPGSIYSTVLREMTKKKRVPAGFLPSGSPDARITRKIPMGKLTNFQAEFCAMCAKKARRELFESENAARSRKDLPNNIQ